MKLTTKQIKQIIKEELNKLLNENQQSIEALAKKFLERTKKEPEAWKQEYDQYLSMLRNKQYEDLLSLLEGEQVGYEIFAYMLVNLEEEIREIGPRLLGRNFPNLFSLILIRALCEQRKAPIRFTDSMLNQSSSSNSSNNLT